MKIFKRIITLLIPSLVIFISKPVFAVTMEGDFEPLIQRYSYWQAVLGDALGRSFDAYLTGLFNYSSVVRALETTSWFTNFVFIIFLAILVGSVFKMLSYAKTEFKWFHKLKLIGIAVKKSPTDYFSNYCARNPDGNYNCSYTDHKTYHKYSRISLLGSFYAIGLKIAIVTIVFLIQGGYFSVFAGRESGTYSIFADTYSSGGHSTSSSGFALNDSFGEPVQGMSSSSGNYSVNAGFIASERDAVISLSFPTDASLPFGELTLGSTAFSAHTMTINYTGDRGYDLYIRNDAPARIGGTEMITPIGHTPAGSLTSTSQYGINLAANTVPAIVGSAPEGGSGQVNASYLVPNSYAFLKDDVIAYAVGSAGATLYTVTAIMNFSSITPAGSYTTTMLYELVPRF